MNASGRMPPGQGVVCPPLIGHQNHRLLALDEVVLVADVALSIKEQHPQHPSGAAEKTN